MGLLKGGGQFVQFRQHRPGFLQQPGVGVEATRLFVGGPRLLDAPFLPSLQDSPSSSDDQDDKD